ncbi:uncharacterized protein DUF397 [Nocardia tenerifensis]|uniref:Uncharacterized protein DUF397 n=1 Tax=Nocardia tenerifensis TaxID=228006 RepID=A0A318JT14_9NOCA|nr:DUF397 domain-containing protein [Nocardia tenerifensis]PXX53974.1 uncharacterized protein DUF397 [Nocardia tenerifensis]
MKTTIETGHLPLDGYVKASLSDGGGNCVLVRRRTGEQAVFIRDSKYLRDPHNRPEVEPVIEMPSAAWAGFQSTVLEGAPTSPDSGQPTLEEVGDGGVILRGTDGTRLAFTAEEWSAFRAGLARGEFEPRPIAA